MMDAAADFLKPLDKAFSLAGKAETAFCKGFIVGFQKRILFAPVSQERVALF